MKQCPTCHQMMWLESDGLWHCNNCHIAVALTRGDQIFRLCTQCTPAAKLQFDHREPNGYIFGCPNCEFQMSFH